MGSKKDSPDPKIQVVEYSMSMHMGICHGPVDRLKQILVGEKVAWSAGTSETTALSVSRRNLFGGEKKEGGVSGTITALFGDEDQTMPSGLASRLGRTVATCPGFRGLLSLFFTGSSGGFIWGHNTPYLKPVWAEVERVNCEWLNEYAAIPRGNAPSALGRDEIVDLDAIANGGVDATAGLTSGVALSGFHADQVVTFSLPAGEAYVAWSPWGEPEIDGTDTGSRHRFEVIRDGDAGDMVQIGSSTLYDGYEAARAAFPGGGASSITGASSYTFFIRDTPLGDNSGGVSVRVHADAIGTFDRNPAHIIYESLTNTDWGMAGAVSGLDLDSFEAAAITLYDEQFGLSLQWVQQSDIQTFVGEILDHIEASLFLHPRTGLLTLKLIRDDYDAETLPVISPENATLSNWDRKSHGEIVNEVIVSWTNPDSEAAETVYAQDLASISTQGLISDTRNYYGVRYRDLANRLAHRDLRAANAPLAICEAVLDRTQWDIVPGDVVKLTWPEYGIEQLVMRVGPVDYGKPGDPAIKVSLAEDVFGLDQGAFHDPVDSEWDDPREDPSPVDYHELLTLPYWTTVQVLGSAGAAAAVYPASAAGILAAQDGSDTSSYDVMTEVTDATGAVGFETVATRPILSRLELAGALDAEAESVVALSDEATQGDGPAVAGLVFIGTGGDTAMEIAMVTAVGEADVTVLRGVLDTVPRAWPAGTPVWFVNANLRWHDPTERAAFETANYKILPRTSLGPLDEADAATVSFEVGERPHLPSRPADVKVNGTGWGEVDSIDTDPVTVTVAERNRLTEDSQILGWTDATVTPESGQTWKVELLAPADRSVIATVDGLTGTSTTIAHSVFAGHQVAIARVTAERDGLESLQGHEITVLVSGITADTDLYTADTDLLTADHG